MVDGKRLTRWTGDLECGVVLQHPAVLVGDLLAGLDGRLGDHLAIDLTRVGVDERCPGMEDVGAAGIEPFGVLPGGANRHSGGADGKVLTSGDGRRGCGPHTLAGHAGATDERSVNVNADQRQHVAPRSR